MSRPVEGNVHPRCNRPRFAVHRHLGSTQLRAGHLQVTFGKPDGQVCVPHADILFCRGHDAALRLDVSRILNGDSLVLFVLRVRVLRAYLVVRFAQRFPGEGFQAGVIRIDGQRRWLASADKFNRPQPGTRVKIRHGVNA